MSLNQKQTPPTSNLGSKMEAEQRVVRVGTIHLLPEKECQNCQLIVDRRNSNIDSLQRLLGSREKSRAEIPNLRHVIGGAIFQEYIPSRVKANS